MAQLSTFYVYVWLRLDGSPWYVGKGRKDRAFIRTKRHWAPKDRSKIRLFPMTDEDTAFAYERYFISFYGRRDLGTGVLRNRTDGGEGPSGLIHSLASRLKMTHKVSEENRQIVRKAQTGNKHAQGHVCNAESIQRLRLAHLGKAHPHRGHVVLKTTRDAISTKLKGVVRSIATRQRMADAARLREATKRNS